MAFWPFRRRGRDSARDTEPTAASPAPAPVASPPPVATGAWRHLPPLAPTGHGVELTAPVQRLADTITPNRRTDLTLEPLGHEVSASAPTGVVGGILRPTVSGGATQRLADDAPMVFAARHEPVPAADAVPLRRWPEPAPVSSPPSPAPSPSMPPPPSGAPAPGQSSPTSRPTERPAPTSAVPTSRAAPAPQPERARTAAPAVQRLSDGAPVARPSAASSPHDRLDPASPLPVVAPRPMRVVDTTVTPPSLKSFDAPLPVPDVQRLVSDTAAGSPEPAPADAAPSSTPPTPTPALIEPPSLKPLAGSTRVVRRLGEPLRARPSGMHVPGEARDPLPLATPPAPAPSLQRLVSDTVAAGPSAPGELPARAAFRAAIVDAPDRSSVSATDDGPRRSVPPGSSRPALPLLGPARRAMTSPEPIQRLTSVADESSVAPVSDGPRPAPVPVRRDVAGSVPRGVQRSPEGVPGDLRAELEPALGTSLSDVKVHRDPEAGEAARELRAKAFTAGGEVFLPAHHGPTSSGEARSILAHELTHVAQQRRLGDAVPAEDSPEGAALEQEARVVGGQAPGTSGQPLAQRLAQRLPQPAARPVVAAAPQRPSGHQPPVPVRPLPSRHGSPPEGLPGVVPGVARLPVAHEPAVPSSDAGSPMAIVEQIRAAASSAGVEVGGVAPASAPGPATGGVQRLAAAEQPSVPVQRAVEIGEVSTTAITEPESAREPDLDELARRLYPKFRTRLRRDLLADRERSGRLFDLR